MGSLILSFRNITPLIAPQDYFTQYYASRWKVSPKTLGNFNNDGDGDGDGSENVTFKMNSRLLKRSRIHWISLKRSKVSEFSWRWIHLGTALKFRKRKKHFHVAVVHKFRVHPCILIKLCCLLSLSLFFFSNINLYLLLPLKWSVHDTCIPSHPSCLFPYFRSFSSNSR